MMQSWRMGIGFFLVSFLLCVNAYGQSGYDIVILNGRVMDPETKYDSVANVGVKNGKIAVITKDKISGQQTIDAKGLVVAPGFIDTHSHIVSLPFGQKLALRDGVTTPLELELGVYPVDVFYNNLEGRSQTNYGATVSPMGIREKVFNPKYDSRTGSYVIDSQIKDESTFFGVETLSKLPTAEQIEQISDMVEEGLRRGALGIGVPVGYMSHGTTSIETVDWQRLAGKYGRATFLHGRFSSQRPPTTGILAFQEMISSAAAYGGGVLLQHLHQQSLSETPDALKMVDAARARGVRVAGEVYPYNFGATIVGADYLVPSNYGPNMGRTFKDIIETATMKPLTKERYEELMKSNPTASVMFYGITEQGMLDALAYPGVIVGSDAFPLTVTKTGNIAMDWNTAYEDVQGHPRAAGTHSRVLRLVREKKLMPLMTAVAKMTYLPAKFLDENGVAPMASKGRIQVGKDADITVFDPKTVRDNSTIEKAGLPATGIPYVVVNGVIVVKDSRVLKDVFPGRPVRLPVITATK